MLLNRHRYRARTEVIRGTSRQEYESTVTAGKPLAKARMAWPQVVREQQTQTERSGGDGI